MKWISAADLDIWANKVTSRAVFPELIYDLINATVPHFNRMRFPNGDKGQVRGFDGILEVNGEYGPVPNGLSIWEFGVNKNASSKAESDYLKRTNDTDEKIRKKASFIFVSLRTWDNPQKKLEDWIQEKRASNEWGNVEYLDGVAIENWLSVCPAVAMQYAQRELGLYPQHGVSSIGTYWGEYSNKFCPPIIEEVLLAGREEQSKQLISNLMNGNKHNAFAADSPEEVIAFTVATIRKAEPEIRLFLENRTIVVETLQAAKMLAVTKSNLIFLPRDHARDQASLLCQKGPTVFSASLADRVKHEILIRPSSQQLAQAIEKMMGCDFQESYIIARKCGRSLSALARLYPSGHRIVPAWRVNGSVLIPALLAGAWDSSNSADRAILCCLASSVEHEIFEAPLRALILSEDSPIDRAGDIWSMRASVDAFIELGHLLGDKHLELLKIVLKTVFSNTSIKPKASASDLFQPELEKQEVHSHYLREGLMNILLHMAVLHEQAHFNVRGMKPQDYVNDIVRNFSGLSSDYRFLASFESNLMLLAEAAPDPFLEALEHLLEGDAAAISPIFYENTNVFAKNNEHVGLLWALETLAWEPKLLLRVSMCLARLAVIDPGGKLSNRPINSLQAIFLTWAPNTNANEKQRSSVLTYLIKHVPIIAWELLEKLLPSKYSISAQTQKPKFRESSQEFEILTYGIVWQGEATVIDLAIKNTNHIAERWIVLIKSMHGFQEQSLNEMIYALDMFLTDQSENSRFPIWNALLNEVNRHIKYANADWVFDSAVLCQLQELVEKYKPLNQMLVNLWLFDENLPSGWNASHSFDDSIAFMESERMEAIRRIIDNHGFDGLIIFTKQVKNPFHIAEVLIKLNLSKSELLNLLDLLFDEGDGLDVIIDMISSQGVILYKEEWLSELKLLVSKKQLSSSRIAQLFMMLPEERSSWELVDTFGEIVSEQYWKKKQNRFINGTQEDLIISIKNYLLVNRPISAIASSITRLAEIPSSILTQLLDESVTEINQLSSHCEPMNSYYFEQVFNELGNRGDILEDTILRLEFAYLPLLEQRNKPLNLHSKMINSSKFFIEIICAVYKASNIDDTDISETQKTYAKAGYTLLNGLRTIPGQIGEEINYDALYQWCLNVRELAKNVDRQEVADLRVGRLLAYAPISQVDKAWPHESVRRIIEELASENIEQGIISERFNMRGVYSKQIDEGGKQERDFSNQAINWANNMHDYPRTYNLLHKISERWLRMAQQEDIEADQRKLLN